MGKKYDERKLFDLKKPSRMIQKISPIVTGESLIYTWKKYITDKQIQKAIEILKIFGLEKIYSHDSMPQSKNLALFHN